MKFSKTACVLVVVATIVALALRLPRLKQRPMHADEAVQAIKFGQLLEDSYYLKMLIYSKYDSGPVWTEALIVFLGVAGFVVAMTGKRISAVNSSLPRFIAFYTTTMTLLYSIIPYKTPWCLLGFHHGMILLASVGAVALINMAPNLLSRMLIGLLLLAGAAHLTWQAYLGSYKYYADPVNPYVYAHTSTDVYTIVERVKKIVQVHPEGDKMHIQVICPENDYWPLPWYLRVFPNVGWWDKVSERAPTAPVIITSASLETALAERLYELPVSGKRNLYVPLFDSYVELRPGVQLVGFVTKDLWDSYRQHQRQSVRAQINM